MKVSFLVVLRHSNSISVISQWWYDAWDEEEKAWAYTFTNSRDLLPPIPFRHAMRGTGLWWCCKLYTTGTWIAAQLNVIALTLFIPLSPGSSSQCLHRLRWNTAYTSRHRQVDSIRESVWISSFRWEFQQCEMHYGKTALLYMGDELIIWPHCAHWY